MRTAGVELSKKNKYWIGKHRFLELYHYCLQYKDWQDEYNSLDGKKAINCESMPHGSVDGDPTYELAVKRAELKDRMELLHKTAQEADAALWTYILRSVTDESASYSYLRNKLKMPCGEKTYYQIRRKFYWLLDKKLRKK